jgi:hypothetical protein
VCQLGYFRTVHEDGLGVSHEFEIQEYLGTTDIDLPETELPESDRHQTSEKSHTGTLHSWDF